MEVRQEREVRDFFLISILLKGAASLVEVAAGLFALFIPVSTVTNTIVRLAEGELAEEPGDFIATHLVQLAHQFAFASGTFIAVYLLSRGLIKLGLVAALLKNKLWAYPSSLVVLGLFVLYQLYQINISHSILLILLTLFDLVVMYFIWEEYTIVRAHVQARAAQL
ncbi:MAG TPA: DUF2127 domain-containing protein [Candidatus Paceibacterota bacterium]